MSISKNQTIMIAIGGVSFVAVAALGYLSFAAFSSKGEAEEECEMSVSTIQRLLRADVSPDKESVLAYKKNANTLSGWSDAAIATASVGDRATRMDVNAAAFKQKLVDEARALSQLEGAVDGKIVKPDFTFGFPDYVTGDKIPEDARLPQLQRQWGDISLVFSKLQACGVAEIVAIAPDIQSAATPEADGGTRKSRTRKGKKKAEQDEEKPAYTVEKYTVDFRAKPAALVKAINAFATSERFVIIDSFSFAREADMIGAALGEEDKSEAKKQTGRRRRRRSAGFAEEAAEAEAKEKSVGKGVVNDPVKEAPFLVKMVVSVYDFGSADKASPAPEADGDSEKKEEE